MRATAKIRDRWDDVWPALLGCALGIPAGFAIVFFGLALWLGVG